MTSTPTRERDCRYCERYGRACGRPHTAATYGDWGRDWKGRPVRVHTVHCHLDSFACAAENLLDEAREHQLPWDVTHAQLMMVAHDYRDCGLMSCTGCGTVAGDVLA